MKYNESEREYQLMLDFKYIHCFGIALTAEEMDQDSAKLSQAIVLIIKVINVPPKEEYAEEGKMPAVVFECKGEPPAMKCRAEDPIVFGSPGNPDEGTNLLTLSLPPPFPDGEGDKDEKFMDIYAWQGATGATFDRGSLCYIDEVGPLAQRWDRLKFSGYSGGVIVPLATALCERFNRPLQFLGDGAQHRCASSSGEVKEITLSSITLFRKGQTYYNRFGFLVCERPRSEFCPDYIEMSQASLSVEHVDHINGMAHLNSWTKDCFAREKLSERCPENGNLGKCLDYMMSCNGGTSNKDGCAAFAALVDSEAFEGWYSRGNRLTHNMYCRKSEPSGRSRSSHHAATKEYVDYGPTTRFDAFAYARALNSGIESRGACGGDSVGANDPVPCDDQDAAVYKRGDPSTICDDVITLGEQVSVARNDGVVA